MRRKAAAPPPPAKKKAPKKPAAPRRRRVRRTVESDKSRCKRDTGSLRAKNSNSALAMPKLPSAFSKSIGFTFCGMVEEPTSPVFVFCLSQSSLI